MTPVSSSRIPESRDRPVTRNSSLGSVLFMPAKVRNSSDTAKLFSHFFQLPATFSHPTAGSARVPGCRSGAVQQQICNSSARECARVCARARKHPPALTQILFLFIVNRKCVVVCVVLCVVLCVVGCVVDCLETPIHTAFRCVVVCVVVCVVGCAVLCVAKTCLRSPGG